MQAQVLCSQRPVLVSSPQSSLRRECEPRSFPEDQGPGPSTEAGRGEGKKQEAFVSSPLWGCGLRAAEAPFLPGRTHQWHRSGGKTAWLCSRKIRFPLDAFSSTVCQERLRSQRATRCCLLPARSSPCDHRLFLKRGLPQIPSPATRA